MACRPKNVARQRSRSRQAKRELSPPIVTQRCKRDVPAIRVKRRIISSTVLREKDQEVIISSGTVRCGVLTDERDVSEANPKPLIAGFVQKHAVLDVQFAGGDRSLTVCHLSSD